jgi:hypothetical protein
MDLSIVCTFGRKLAAARPSHLEQWLRTAGVGCTLTKALPNARIHRVFEIVVLVGLQ